MGDYREQLPQEEEEKNPQNAVTDPLFKEWDSHFSFLIVESVIGKLAAYGGRVKVHETGKHRFKFRS